MKESDKKLLAAELCARLPYGIKVTLGKHTWVVESVSFEKDGVYVWIEGGNFPIHAVNPYLRPLSSMTDDEEKEMQEINHRFCKEGKYITAGVFSAEDCGCTVYEMAEIMSYLNAHHFDYRGLIEKGLAVEAYDDMYKSK